MIDPPRGINKLPNVDHLSSIEAEHTATAESVEDILYARQILAFMRLLTKLEAVTLHEDKNGAINLAKTPMGSARAKHIDIRYHFISRSFEKGTHKNCVRL